jgi:hypothetical protein
VVFCPDISNYEKKNKNYIYMFPIEIINKIMCFMQSPTNIIIKNAISYYKNLKWVGISFKKFYFMNVMYKRRKILILEYSDEDDY